jgi:hypothetical protein
VEITNTQFLTENLKGRSNLEGLGADVREVEIRWESVDWIHLAYGRDQWWALLEMVMNLLFP